MAGYSYNPDKKKTDLAAEAAREENGVKVSALTDFLLKNKSGVILVVAMVALIFIIGPMITGSLLFQDPEYAELSVRPDFPHLAKEKSNLELYKCRSDLSDVRTRFTGCESGLSSTQELYSSCSSAKVELTSGLENYKNNYESCRVNSDKMKSDIDSCTNSLAIKETNLGTCNSELNIKEARLDVLESERDEIFENYASQVCCPLKYTIKSLKYYKVVNNRIVCSETKDTDESKEFSC